MKGQTHTWPFGKLRRRRQFSQLHSFATECRFIRRLRGCHMYKKPFNLPFQFAFVQFSVFLRASILLGACWKNDHMWQVKHLYIKMWYPKLPYGTEAKDGLQELLILSQYLLRPNSGNYHGKPNTVGLSRPVLPFCPFWFHTLICLNSPELHCWRILFSCVCSSFARSWNRPCQRQHAQGMPLWVRCSEIPNLVCS